MSNDVRPRSEAEFTRTRRTSSLTEGCSESPETATRRLHGRFRVELDVTVTSEHNFYAGFVENMSVGGVFIATHQLALVGERLDFAVQLPGEAEPIRGAGVVRWLRVYSEASNGPPGMGIKFDMLDAASQRAIDAFLAERAPLFHEED